MSQFKKLLLQGASPEQLADHLDGLSHNGRLEAIEALQGNTMSVLYERAAGQHTDIEFFVPEEIPDGQPVVHHGVNSLPWPVGGTFRKPMVRAAPGLVYGYNDNDGIVSLVGWFTGPGYFTLRARGTESPDGRSDFDGQVFVNYYEQPGERPVQHWPDPKPSMNWSASLVFGDMCDYMWRVSKHVSVGAAFKRGKPMGAWFALIRQQES
ncbi:MAG: hypothetical protein CMH53_08405 [Myxococcales bacterium]|nr:hypothetical protein [Myxococcales bacterium]